MTIGSHDFRRRNLTGTHDPEVLHFDRIAIVLFSEQHQMASVSSHLCLVLLAVNIMMFILIRSCLPHALCGDEINETLDHGSAPEASK